ALGRGVTARRRPPGGHLRRALRPREGARSAFADGQGAGSPRAATRREAGVPAAPSAGPCATGAPDRVVSAPALSSGSSGGVPVGRWLGLPHPGRGAEGLHLPVKA